MEQPRQTVPVRLPEYGITPTPAAPSLQPTASAAPQQAGGISPRIRQYDSLIEQQATQAGIDPNLLRAIVHVESRGNPNAVSEVGAMGLAQLMPDTARRFGVTDPRDPAQNLAGSARYLKFLLGKYNGDYDRAVAAYHAGEGNLDNYLNNKPSAFGPRSKEYPALVRQAYESLAPRQQVAAPQQRQRMVALDPSTGEVLAGNRRIKLDDTGSVLAAMQSGTAFVDRAVPGMQMVPAEQAFAAMRQRAKGYTPLFGSAVDQYQAGLQELGGAIASGLGADRAAESLFQGAAANREAANAVMANSDIPLSVDDVTLGNFGTYIAGQLVNSSPYIAEFLATGLGAGAAGKALVTRAIAGRVEKMAAEQATRLMSKGMAEAAARDLARRQVQARVAPLLAKASESAAKLGQFAVGSGSAFGDIVNTQREAGMEDPNYTVATLGAPIYSLLNFIGLEGQLGRGLRKFGAIPENIVGEGLKGRLGAGIVGGALATGKSALGEVPSELGQEAINQFGTPGGVWSAEAQKSYVESAFGALAGSAGTAGSAGAVRGALASKQPVGGPGANPDRGAGPVAQPLQPGQQGNLFGAPEPAVQYAPEQVESDYPVPGATPAAPQVQSRAEFEPTAADMTPDLFGQDLVGSEAGMEQGFADNTPNGLAGRITRGNPALRAQLLSNQVTRQALTDIANGRQPDVERLQRLAQLNPDNAAVQRLLQYITNRQDPNYNPEADVTNLQRGEAAQQRMLAEQQAAREGSGLAGPQPQAPVQESLFGPAEVMQPIAEEQPRLDAAAEREMADAAAQGNEGLFPPERGPQVSTDVAATKRRISGGITTRQYTSTVDEYATMAAEAIANQSPRDLREVMALLDDDIQGRNMVPSGMMRLMENLDGELQQLEQQTAPMETKDESLPNTVARRTTSATEPLAPDTARGTMPTEFLSAQEARQQRRMQREPKPFPVRNIDQAGADQRAADEARQAELDAATQRDLLEVERATQRKRQGDLFGGRQGQQPNAPQERTDEPAGSPAQTEMFGPKGGIKRNPASGVKETMPPAQRYGERDQPKEAPKQEKSKPKKERAPKPQRTTGEQVAAEVIAETAALPQSQQLATFFRRAISEAVGVRRMAEYMDALKAMRGNRDWSDVTVQEVAEVAAPFQPRQASAEDTPSDRWERLYAAKSSTPAGKYAQELASKLLGDARVLMVGSETDIPQWMQQDRAAGNKGAFFFDENGDPQVVIYTTNITDADDKVKTVLHEIVGHAGLFSLLGDKTNGVLEGIYRSNKEFKIAADLMMADGMERTRALQEAMAMAAENIKALKGWKAFVAKVREVLRDILGDRFVGWSDDDIVQLLNRASKAPISGAKLSSVGNVGPRMRLNRTAATKSVERAMNDLRSNAKSLASGAKGLKTQLPLMTPEQIVRTFRSLFDGPGVNPMEKFRKAETKAESIVNNVSAEIQPLVHRIAALPAGQAEELGGFMNRATALRVYPDRAYADQPWLKGDSRHAEVTEAEYDTLVRQWKALTPDQRSIASDTWQQFAKWKARLHQSLKELRVDAGGANQRDVTASLNKIDAMFNEIKGPYSPLHRTGEWLVVAQNGDDRDSRIVSAFESEADARAFRESLLSAGGESYRGKKYQYADSEANVIHSVRTAEQEGKLFGMTPGTFDVLKDIVDGLQLGGENSAEAAALKETLVGAVTNLYASGLPGANIAQRAMLLHRQGITGASTDLQRAVADTGKSMGFLISRVTTEPELQQALYNMREMSREPGPLQNKRAILTNHMAKLNQMHREPTSNAWTSYASQAGYLMYLGFSPSFVALQALQAPMITYPVLAAKYGYGNTYGEMMRAMKDATKVAASVAGDELKNALGGARTAALSATPFGKYLEQLLAGNALNDQTVYSTEELGDINAEVDMLRTAFEQNKINVTMTHDVQAVAKGEAGWQRALMRAASWAPQQAEMANRVGTALAAYRLAKNDPRTMERASQMRAAVTEQTVDALRRRVMTSAQYRQMDEQQQLDLMDAETTKALAALDARLLHEAAVEQALETLDKTQFDYSGSNKPMFMSGTNMRVLAPFLMFKSYSQHMLHLLLSNANQAMRGETPEVKAQARRALAGLIASHSAVGGLAAGLPLGGWGAIEVIRALMATATDDDDWDKDAQAAFYDNIRSVLGKEAADVAMYGGFRLIGMDLGQRTGLNTLNVLPGAPIHEGREGAREWIANLSGPIGSILMNYWDAADNWHKYDTDKLVTLTAPKFIADAARAYGQATKGTETASGLQAISPEQYGALSTMTQAFGFTSPERQDYYRARKVQAAAEREIAKDKEIIKRAFADALVAKDAKARAEAEQAAMEFNKGKTGADRLTRADLYSYARRRGTEQERLSSGELSRSPAAMEEIRKLQ